MNGNIQNVSTEIIQLNSIFHYLVSWLFHILVSCSLFSWSVIQYFSQLITWLVSLSGRWPANWLVSYPPIPLIHFTKESVNIYLVGYPRNSQWLWKLKIHHQTTKASLFYLSLTAASGFKRTLQFIM